VLTVEENETLTRVGPGTPMGGLMRRYWHPVAVRSEMADRYTMRVRLLGEDLVLYRDRSGTYGLLAEFCPHRRASLAYGIPEVDGLRCPYHGWKFDRGGSCIETPNEPEGSTFASRVTTPGYPVQELGGLLWAYLGPAPAPLLPRWDGFVAEGAIRHVGKAVIPCNYLQIMENSVDPVHTEWLHGRLYEFLQEDAGVKVAISKHHAKIAFDEKPYGIVKRRLLVGQSEDVDDWTIGHPVVFPTMLAVGSGGGLWHQYSFQIRTPIDDTHTQHYWFHAYMPPKGADVPEHLLANVPMYEPPVLDEKGEYLLNFIHAQDIMAWVTQGPIADRSREALGASDRGVTMLRKMFFRELKKIENGEDPINVFRDPAGNVRLDLPLEKNKEHYSDGFASLLKRHMGRFSPIADDLLAVFAAAPAAPDDDVIDPSEPREPVFAVRR
jgi:5,5'-dehydrodivanillate O-demethylase